MNKILMSLIGILLIISCKQKTNSVKEIVDNQPIRDSLALEIKNLNKNYFNGLGVAIVDSTGILYEKGIGFADTKLSKPYTTNTGIRTQLKDNPKSSNIVMIATVIVVVATHNLALGVLTGVLLSALFLANKLENDIKELEQVIKNSETQRDKYLYLVGKYKTDIKRLKIRVSNFEKEELGKVTGINVLRIQKENADLRIEVKRLKDRLENLLDDMHKKINQTKVTYDIQVEDLEKELNECKEKLKSVGNEQVLSQKVTYWKEKAKTESQKVDELEQKIMRYADKSVLTKVFASK